MAKKQSLKYLERPDVHWEAMLLKYLALRQNRRLKPSPSGDPKDPEFWIKLFGGDLLPRAWGVNPAVRYSSAYYFALNQFNDDSAVRDILWKLEKSGGELAVDLSRQMQDRYKNPSKPDHIKLQLRQGLATNLIKPIANLFEDGEFDNMADVYRSAKGWGWARDLQRVVSSKKPGPKLDAYRREIEAELSAEKSSLKTIASGEAERIARSNQKISLLRFILTLIKIHQLDGEMSVNPEGAGIIAGAIVAVSATQQDIEDAKKSMAKEDAILKVARHGMYTLVHGLLLKPQDGLPAEAASTLAQGNAYVFTPPDYTSEIPDPKDIDLPLALTPLWQNSLAVALEPTTVPIADLRRVQRYSEIFQLPTMGLVQVAVLKEMFLGNPCWWRDRR